MAADGYGVAYGGDEMLWDQMVVMQVAQLYEYTTTHGAAHIKWACHIACELDLNVAVIF